MTDKLTIAMAQINPTVGDIDGNVARILAARDRSVGADLVVYSELVLSGYPPEDLVLKPFFQERPTNLKIKGGTEAFNDFISLGSNFCSEVRDGMLVTNPEIDAQLQDSKFLCFRSGRMLVMKISCHRNASCKSITQPRTVYSVSCIARSDPPIPLPSRCFQMFANCNCLPKN